MNMPKQPDLSIIFERFHYFVASLLTFQIEMINCFEQKENPKNKNFLPLEKNIRHLLETLKDFHIAFFSIIFHHDSCNGSSKLKNSNNILQLLKYLKKKLKEHVCLLSEDGNRAIFILDQLIGLYYEKENITVVKNIYMNKPWMNRSIFQRKVEK